MPIISNPARCSIVLPFETLGSTQTSNRRFDRPKRISDHPERSIDRTTVEAMVAAEVGKAIETSASLLEGKLETDRLISSAQTGWIVDLLFGSIATL